MTIAALARGFDHLDQHQEEEPELWRPVAGKRALTQHLSPRRRASELQPAVPTAMLGAVPTASTAMLAAPFAMHLPTISAAPVQRKAVTEAVAASPEAVMLDLPNGAGAPLPEGLRRKMEQAMGADFSSVRVREGAHVGAMGARAYAQGTELHFAPGEYQPDSLAGQELIGHELAHVVQQAQGRAGVAQAKGGVLDDGALEAEADEVGARAARATAPAASHEVAPLSVAAAVGDGPVQRARAVKGMVDGAAVVRAHKGGQWMIVQGLEKIGEPQWHLSIFPCGQEKWFGTYKLPANGVRPIAEFMQYDEFHLTSPQGVHFFFTDSCVPLAGSQGGYGNSPAWTKKEAWTAANHICATYFGVDEKWLNDFVEAQVKELGAQKAEQAHLERMFKYYSSYVAQHPEWYAKTQQTFEEWLAALEKGFQGTHEEFVAHMRQEDKDRGGKPPVFPKREWRDDEDGFGYVD